MGRKAVLSAFLLIAAVALAQAPAPVQEKQEHRVRTDAVRGHMEFLAGEALEGRGSGTRNEHIAVTYAAAQMRMMGIEPGLGEGGYIQTIRVERTALAAPPVLAIEGSDIAWKHGAEILVLRMGEAAVSAPLVKLEVNAAAPDAVRAGTFVLLTGATDDDAARNQAIAAVLRAGAHVLYPAGAQMTAQWEQRSRAPLRLPARIGGVQSAASPPAIVALSAAAAAQMAEVAEGTMLRLEGKAGEPEVSATWNAVGRITGSNPELKEEAVLLSAHIDHLGVRGERVFYGADDDASGVTAVLELARALAKGPRPKRTVLFALYGSEEMGGFGSRYFIENPPVALENIVANLQFEMMGRPDPNTPGKLWLTGYKRSDLGAMLAARGAPLVADPYPQQNFFMRSDNYRLAQRGVVAHTVSSYGLHKDYHQPTDTVDKIDVEHMAQAIGWLVEPVRWLADSEWRPQWVEGGRP